jgi:cell division protein FtsA
MVGEITADGSIEVIGIGSHPSRGLKKGVVVNIESTVQSIQRAVEEAELMAGCEIHSVYAGIAGSHVRSLNSHGMVAIRDKEVTPTDVERVIDAAKAVAIPADQKILHVLPQEFIIDGQEGIREPIGMSGVRLEAKVHIVTGAVSAAQNIVKCVQRCGLERRGHRPRAAGLELRGADRGREGARHLPRRHRRRHDRHRRVRTAARSAIPR